MLLTSQPALTNRTNLKTEIRLKHRHNKIRSFILEQDNKSYADLRCVETYSMFDINVKLFFRLDFKKSEIQFHNKSRDCFTLTQSASPAPQNRKKPTVTNYERLCLE